MKKQTKVNIHDIKSNESNPRWIKDTKFKKLVKSIKEFPEMLDLRPIVVDEDMVILGGNMRHKACIEAGIKEIPITIAKGLTDNQKKEFIIKDNIGFGEWDWDLLEDWNTDDLNDWGLDNFDLQENETIQTSEEKDLSETLKETFEVIIECINENEQEKTFETLTKKGYICRVLTL